MPLDVILSVTARAGPRALLWDPNSALWERGRTLCC
jgi:hypothetical protein